MKKGMLFAGIFLLLPWICSSAYYSQCGQDKMIHENYFWDYKSGVFVDIGAHDGITLSNSYFFEQELGWTGICIEPIPEIFDQLVANRKCRCIQGCIANYSGDGQFLRVVSPPGTYNIELLSGLEKYYHPLHFQRLNYELSRHGGSVQSIKVKCYLLNDVLKQNNITHVNFLSIDTEGGEFEILSSIDFSQVQIDVITVEDNYNDSRFLPFLKEKGFCFVQRIGEQDLVFVHRDFTPRNKKSRPFIPITEDQEIFFKLYHLGLSQTNMNESDLALESFFKAYSLRSTRAEPLFQSAKIYREKGNVLLGYLLAKYALSHPCPAQDICVEYAAYDHAILIEFANCALLLGKFKEGFDACNKLLANPNLPPEYRSQIQANYELAREKLAPSSLSGK